MPYCGINVAKTKCSAPILDEKGKVLKPAFSFSIDRLEFDQILGILAESSEPITSGMEATVHYLFSLYDDLNSLTMSH